MRYVFLVNRFSLKDETDIIIERLNLIATYGLGLDYIIEANSNELLTEDIIKKYQNGGNIIVSLGGDGTINRVLNNIINTDNVLGYVPLGTGNDFARSAKEQFNKGFNLTDVVKINDKYFINVACFGIDADIANDETFVDSKIIPRSLRYNASIVNNFFNYEARHMKVYIDDFIYENDYTTIAVCNGKYYGGGYKIGPHAVLNDGLVDIYLIDKLNKLAMAKAILSLKNGHHENNRSTTFMQSNKLCIKSNKPITCNIDGEKLTNDEFNIEVIPKRINVYYDEEVIRELQKVKIKKR